MSMNSVQRAFWVPTLEVGTCVESALFSVSNDRVYSACERRDAASESINVGLTLIIYVIVSSSFGSQIKDSLPLAVVLVPGSDRSVLVPP